MNNKINAPNTVYKEGELEINFNEFISTNKEKIKSELKRSNYQYPSYDVFSEKILYYYSIDITKYRDTVVVLDEDLSPAIAIKDLPAIYVEDNNGDIDGLTLFNYNQFVIYNNKASLIWLKTTRPDLLVELVNTYGFDKDNDILKFVFDKTDFSNKFTVSNLIFRKEGNQFILRENMIRKIREIKYDNQIVEGFSEVIPEDFYYTLPKIIRDISTNQINSKDRNYYISFLLNELTLSGITGEVDSFLDSNPTFQKRLEENSFYNLNMLKSYIETVYEPKEITNSYSIQDPDGYTNLRKEKNSKSEILQQIKNGENVEVLDNEGSWWLVKTKEGKQGYVYFDRVKAEN